MPQRPQHVLTRIVLSLLLAVACLAGPAAAQAPGGRVIAADLGRAKGPLDPMFNLCVGAGRANEALRADWQRQLTTVREQCGFKYLRMHGLLGDDMGVYRETKDGTPQYNWQYVDEVYDFLIRIGMKPFVELGFCPGALASGTQTIFWWKGNVTPPKDPKKWADLIAALVTHWRERYGDAEVRTWYFEVWNEPNLKEFFKGTQQDYFDLYATTARAIKGVSTAYRVGGPATAGCAWATEFIDFCVKNRVPVDFVSSHTYAVGSGFLDELGNRGTVFSQDPMAITGDVRRVRGQIAASALPKLELHITEWSSSYTPADPLHDSYHSAAFVLDKLKNCSGAADSMSYWTFTDIFEEAGPRFEAFHGGFGLMNYQDVRKPAFFAYQFLHRLGRTELQNADPASFACTDGTGNAQVLFWDFTITNPKDENNQTFYPRDLPPKDKGMARVRLSGLTPGRYALAVYRVGYRANDAYAVYKDLGSPPQLTREQVAKLQAASDGRPVEQTTVDVGPDGVFERSTPTRENDVFLMTLTKTPQ